MHDALRPCRDALAPPNPLQDDEEDSPSVQGGEGYKLGDGDGDADKGRQLQHRAYTAVGHLSRDLNDAHRTSGREGYGAQNHADDTVLVEDKGLDAGARPDARTEKTTVRRPAYR